MSTGRGNASRRPDGKPQGQPVSFTRGAADRIAKVVRTVELGDRSAQGLRFGRAAEAAGKIFRICTFTGAWSINSAKTVTFKYQTTTPNTVSVTNLLFPLPSLSNSMSNATTCAIAKDGTAWYLLNVVHSAHTALTSASLSPSALEFGRSQFIAIATTSSTAQVGASACAPQASGSQLSTFFS